MPSFQNEEQQHDVISALQSLLQLNHVTMIDRRGGGNSVVYCVEAGGEKFAVKSYPPYAPGKRDRLAAEAQVYQFLNSRHLPVPQLLKVSEAHRLLLMEWVQGEIPHDYTPRDIEQAIAFIQAVAETNSLPDAKALPLAAEACLSLQVIQQQIAMRLQRLQAHAQDENELQAFLANEFVPVYLAWQKQAELGYRKSGMDPEAELPVEKRSLIPADFGFHNALRTQEGKLYFIDFDYFGWDDPVKLLADILWHPKMILTEQQRQRFIGGIADVYHHDNEFLPRFHYLLPLFGLRWTLIFLNEFLPEFWQNRQHAAVHSSLSDAKVKQLKRARETLQLVQKIGSQHDIISETII